MSTTSVNPRSNVYAVIEVFRHWLHIADPVPLIAMFGAFAANYLHGDPVWLLLIGPSSAGKTEMLMSLAKELDVHVASTLTEASLLSGTPKKERSEDSKGGLLQEIGTFGMILMKDFTSTLSMHQDARTAALAALREIYDGAWVRRIGTDGGLTLSWQGKVGIIGGCTEVIDRYHSVIGIMGPRFLFCRMPKIDEVKVATAALNQTGSEGIMRVELENAATSLFPPNTDTEPLPEATRRRIASLAIFTARCRSSVERNGYTREIELIPQPESPSRLSKQLHMQFLGMMAIGTTEVDAWKVLTKVAFDCIPPIRYRVLAVLAKATAELETAVIAETIHYPATTARRALEDLEAHRVVVSRSVSDGLGYYWRLSDWAIAQLTAIRNPVPEKSEGCQ